MQTTKESSSPTGFVPGSQLGIPCWFMRGGTSRGPFFRRADLPADLETERRDEVLLAALGSGHPLQIDGLGGGNPLTSKVGIVDVSSRDGVDLEFQFAQLQPTGDTVDTTANCGNMLAAVVPFAVEAGLLIPGGDTTTARVLTLNTGMVAEISIPTPAGARGRFVQYAGDTRIDGVPGTAAAVSINFLDTAGSVCASLLPTGNASDTVELDGVGPVRVTCIDNGQPLVMVRAGDLGRTGYESAAELNRDSGLKQTLEALRLQCGHLMGLGDVTARNYPKMTLIAPPAHGGNITTRSFIPHVCHESIGVLAAVTAATACVIDGTVARDISTVSSSRAGEDVTVSVEHPSGEFTVELGLDPQDLQHVTKSALLRTARLIMAGEVFVPGRLGSAGAATEEENAP